MREIVVTLTMEEQRVEALADRLRYVNPDQPSAGESPAAIWTVNALAEVMGWSGSMVRKALGTLYGEGRVTTVIDSRNRPAWVASTKDERAKL